MSTEMYVRMFEVEIDVNEPTATRGGCIGAVPVLGPRGDDGRRAPVEAAWWVLGGLSEPVEHGERIASEGATVRTVASYHEIVATRALCTARRSPQLTVLDPKRFEAMERRCRDAQRGDALLVLEATFPRRSEAGDEAIERLLEACLEGDADVVVGEVREDARTGQMHASAGTTVRSATGNVWHIDTGAGVPNGRLTIARFDVHPIETLTVATAAKR